MNLADHQRALLCLIHNRSCDDISDPYVSTIFESPHLRLVQRIIILWRTYELDHICTLTTGYLQLCGSLEQTITAFVQSARISPFIEELGRSFLDYLARQDNLILAALAKSESSLLAAARGTAQLPVVIEWPCDPNAIFAAVLQHDSHLLEPQESRHHMIVDAALPHYFRVERVDSD